MLLARAISCCRPLSALLTRKAADQKTLKAMYCSSETKPGTIRCTRYPAIPATTIASRITPAPPVAPARA